MWKVCGLAGMEGKGGMKARWMDGNVVFVLRFDFHSYGCYVNGASSLNTSGMFASYEFNESKLQDFFLRSEKNV